MGQCATEKPTENGAVYCMLDAGHSGPHRFINDPRPVRLSPRDNLWLAILLRTPDLTEAELRSAGFPERIIAAWRGEQKGGDGE